MFIASAIENNRLKFNCDLIALSVYGQKFVLSTKGSVLLFYTLKALYHRNVKQIKNVKYYTCVTVVNSLSHVTLKSMNKMFFVIIPVCPHTDRCNSVLFLLTLKC